ncbi:hypothetical protein ACIRRH_31180 [Kitasatospora sp. NPDC101235]|uniref:hypothetical protein n=1 Tax=Kitasatospora sp. NPDC101235 TaxID=3364101 RepID=UPI00381CADA2
MAARPGQLLREERRMALVESTVVAPAIAGTSLAFFHWLNGDPLLIAGGLVIGWSCSAAVLIALSRWGRWTATRLIVAGRRRLPRDVLGFLEDGRQLGVLRRFGVLLLGALALRAVATRLRIDGEGVELNEGRKLRLRWDDVAEARVVRVRSRRNVETGSPGLNVSYCLAMKPVAGREATPSLTDSDGWIRVWELGSTEVVPLDLEVALTRFAADRWRRDV